MASTPTQLRDEIRRNLAFTLTDADNTNADNCILRSAAKWTCHKTSTDAAATTAYRLVLDASLDLQTLISECKVVSNTAVTLNGSNYATISLVYNDGAAGSDVTIATLDTSATAFVAKVARSMTVTAANALVAAAKQLEIVVTKTGTGVSLDCISVIVKGLPV